MRVAAVLLALAGVSFLATFLTHPLVDESDMDALFATAARDPTRWRIPHALLAVAGFVTTAAAATALAEGWRATPLGRLGFALLAASGPALVVIGGLESSVLAHLAATGDRAGFATWRSFANGLFGVVGVLAAGVVALAWADLADRGWRRAAALLVILAAGAVVLYLVGHEWLGARPMAPLFRAFILIAIWLVAFAASELRRTRPGSTDPLRAS